MRGRRSRLCAEALTARAAVATASNAGGFQPLRATLLALVVIARPRESMSASSLWRGSAQLKG
jgi:hypothetical protein